MGTRDHYLQPPQISIIFLSFFLLTLPLSWIQLAPVISPVLGNWLMASYVVLIANTHFAITAALYLNSANLAYFRSSRAREVVYFLVPAAILIGIFAVYFFDVLRPYLWATIALTMVTMAANAFHTLRQSFGVFEMFKARAGGVFPRSCMKVDNLYFLTLWVLQLLTLAGHLPHDIDGTFDPSDPAIRTGVVVAVLLLARILMSLRAAWRHPQADRAAVLTALGYLTLQSLSACLAIYRSRLFVASLAMHYVEYHVLMAPRLFKTPLDLSTRVDRVADVFRRHKAVFYILLAFLSMAISAGPVLGALGHVNVTKDSAAFSWAMVNLLNGIFLAHYFVEAFVWKFGNPFYRETLSPIYFARSPAPALRRQSSRQRARA